MMRIVRLTGKWAFAIALVAGAIAVMTREEEQTRIEYKRECQSHIAAVPVASRQQANSADECKDPKDYMPWWYVLIAWPDGITTWAILATLAGILWQAKATASATNAAYGSVQFAEAQWRLLIEKERARVDIDAETKLKAEIFNGTDLMHLIAILRVRNIGETQARIRSAGATLITKTAKSTTEDGDGNPSSLSLPDKFIESKAPIVEVPVYHILFDTKAEEFADGIEKAVLSVHLYGFIEYETLGYCYRREFGYVWNVVSVALGEMLGLGTPFYANSPRSPKERIEYGFWRTDEEKDVPEYSIGCDQPQNPN